MKKVIVALLVISVILTGCGSKPTQKEMVLNLEQAVKNIDEVKNSEGNGLFGMMGDITKEMLKGEPYQVDPANIQDLVFKEPMINVQASSYLIAKPVKGKEAIVKEQFDSYFKKVEQKWSNYLPDQLDMVKNRLVTTVGDYFIVIISADNQKVLDAIKAAEQK